MLWLVTNKSIDQRVEIDACRLSLTRAPKICACSPKTCQWGALVVLVGGKKVSLKLCKIITVVAAAERKNATSSSLSELQLVYKKQQQGTFEENTECLALCPVVGAGA